MIKIKMGEENTNLPVSMKTDPSMKARMTTNGTNDYNQLKNLPTLNGKPIIGDVSEEDPTVPNWAKQEKKPNYTAEEINALDAGNAISLSYLASLFD